MDGSGLSTSGFNFHSMARKSCFLQFLDIRKLILWKVFYSLAHKGSRSGKLMLTCMRTIYEH